MMKLKNLYEANAILIRISQNRHALEEIDSSDEELTIRPLNSGCWHFVVGDPELRAKILELMEQDVARAKEELKTMGFEFSDDDILAWKPANLEGPTD